MKEKIKIIQRYRGKYLYGDVVQADALIYLRSLKPETADIIFFDPPFNLGKVYNKRNKKLDSKPKDTYREWMNSILREGARVLKEGGALYLYHIPSWAMRFGNYLDKYLDFNHWIAISMKNGFMRGNRLYPAHYALLMFAKGKPQYFTRPKIEPKKCKCGRYIKDYGGYRAIIEERGINLSDYWDDLSPVRHANRKHREANELPKLLFERVIEISGAPGIVYLDPFAGAGSGVIAAARARLEFKACDIVPANCRLICKRLKRLKNILIKEK